MILVFSVHYKVKTKVEGFKGIENFVEKDCIKKFVMNESSVFYNFFL